MVYAPRAHRGGGISHDEDVPAPKAGSTGASASPTGPGRPPELSAGQQTRANRYRSDYELSDADADRLAREALSQGIGLEELSNALIDAALAEERGNVSAAARRILSRARLSVGPMLFSGTPVPSLISRYD